MGAAAPHSWRSGTAAPDVSIFFWGGGQPRAGLGHSVPRGTLSGATWQLGALAVTQRCAMCWVCTRRVLPSVQWEDALQPPPPSQLEICPFPVPQRALSALRSPGLRPSLVTPPHPSEVAQLGTYGVRNRWGGGGGKGGPPPMQPWPHHRPLPSSTVLDPAPSCVTAWPDSVS